MMNLKALALISLASLVHAATQPGLTADQSFCPSCIGTKYTDPSTGQSGCCPSGTQYQPASCVAIPARITCPADNGHLYTMNGYTYKVYCDMSTNGGSDLGLVRAADAQACVDQCAAIPNCNSPSYYAGQCWLSSQVKAPNTLVYQAGAVSFLKQ
ncbi:hypothetical protein VE00_10673 [Pseudogymnoascus sp. WSF 3629]|nr:hypothetical protein VE00_10673 [Pseudogymnoascus sp. WSF 3629]